MFEEFGINAGFVEDLHARYVQSPHSVPDEWREFFDSAENNRANGVNGAGANGVATNGVNGASYASPIASQVISQVTNGVQTTSAEKNERILAAAALKARVYQLVNAYRVRGHLFAKIDPLGKNAEAAPELDLANFGLTDQDLDAVFPTVGVHGLPERATLQEIIAHLSETYCGAIGVEFTHIEEPEMREWLQNAMESTRNRATLANEEVLRVLTGLTDAEIFEQFVHKNFVGAKRFSGEGAESMIAMLDLLIDGAGAHGVEEIVIAMAHRGRLSVLANIFKKPALELFAAFNDRNPERFLGGGDVKYHLGYSCDRVTTSGKRVHLSLCFNPSHLEFVNPVAEGRVRAKQDRQKRSGIVPLVIHGDAAFMGQGVVPETLNLAGLEGYSTCGTVHLVVNNQIGFTTVPEDSRSTRYCTDITRMLKVPVFHVNGEDPEAVIQVARLAMEFRQRFAKDVVIDMLCYRRYGHNEADEPRFTQPLMYKLIDKKPTVRETYVHKLVSAGKVTQEQADRIVAERKNALSLALEQEKKGDYLKPPNAMEGLWSSYYGGPDAMVPGVETGVKREVLTSLIETMTTLPATFHPNPKVKKLLETRREHVVSGQGIDWGNAEQLAYATLLAENARVRLSGQDVRRGTFTHRHAALYDTETGERYVPLSQVGPGKFEVFDSPLSEAGVLGFEYGYSLDCPDGLVIWEAQFGDFTNGAQVIVDQFIVSAEDKWLRLSGLVLLLPHGYEGQGPEHSSARVERFLQMAAEDNIQLCNVTTAAQFFHLLRRQVRRPWRKPLVVFTPKSLLRDQKAASPIEDFTSGEFQRVIADQLDPKGVRRVLMCSGKVYYDLVAARKARARDDVAIIRLEQLYPLGETLPKALAPYASGTPLVWVQEEPRNAGAWYFLNANIMDTVGTHLPLSCVSRESSASPATGSKASHELEQKRLIDEAFAG